MPATITGDPTNFPTSVQVPSDGDGPGIKAADINPALEGLMDRTEFLYRHGGYVVASLGALPAVDANDGDVVFIPYLGYYYFSLGLPSGNEDGLLAVRNAADTGTWYWEAYSLLAGETGSPYTADDGLALVQGGKLAYRVIPNATVAVVPVEASITFDTTSNSFVDAHVETPITVKTGDRMLIRVQGHLLAESSYVAAAQVVVSDPDGNDYAKESSLRRTNVFTTSDNNFIPYSANCVHIVQANGDAAVKVQVRSIQVGAHAYYQGHPTMSVQIVRP